MSRLRRQMSYSASLSTWFVTSVCSRRECTHSTVLYGSTQADEICGHDHTVNEIFDFLTDGVVAAGEVVGGILLTGDQLLRVEELAVGTRADLIDHGRLQVDEHRARDVLASTGF